MAAVHDANSILVTAVREVLSQYKEDSPLDTSNLAVYEQHFQQVAPEGADSCSVDLARQHFSSMLQGEAFDAILERVSGPSAELGKDQFLAITHLVHSTLETAQNSDALWVEPEPAPAPTGKKKRHPTVEEVLGSRLVEAASSVVSLEDGEGCDPGMPSVDSKENRHVAANKAGRENSRLATPRDEQQQPGRQPAAVPSSRNQSPRPQPGSGDPGAADVTDFERKLQDLMRRMQLDQAKLQGKAATSGRRKAGGDEADGGLPDKETSWESFNSSPPQPKSDRSAAAAATVAFESFPAAGPSPFHDLNPLKAGQSEAQLLATPAAALPGARQAPFNTPEAQRDNNFAGGGAALDANALSAAVQQLSIQQALAAQLAAGEGGAAGPVLTAADPETVAAIARAQMQLEAAAATLVAAATARPHLVRSESASARTSPGEQHSADRSSGVRQSSSLDTTPTARQSAAVPFGTVHSSSPKLGRQKTAPHTVGALSRPSRLSHQGSPGAADCSPMTARAAAQCDVVDLSSWGSMPAEDRQRCEDIFVDKGYEAQGGMRKPDAQQLFARLQMAPYLFQQVYTAADIDKDGVLSKPEFCLFMYILRMVQKGFPVPLQLTASQAAALLGQRPSSGPQEQLKLDLLRIRSALKPTGRLPVEPSAPSQQSHDDREELSDSDTDSGFESVTSPMSGVSKSSHGQLHSHLHAASPLVLRSPNNPLFDSSGGGVHGRLTVSVRSAEVHYNKPLEKPFFTISVHDSLLRPVELPHDTPPGHYRKELHTITLNHGIQLTTPLAQMPRGSVVYIELKHFKSREGRMSTLAWAYLPVEKVVDFGPAATRVREGPLCLPLFRKPLDLSLRRLKRIGRGDDLRLNIDGTA